MNDPSRISSTTLTTVSGYTHEEKLLLAVDCIIFGFDDEKLKILLVKRNVEPLAGKWSLMGGFVYENEDVDHAAQRVLNTLTGLENVYLEQLKTYGQPQRDPGGRIVSVAYSALINIADHNQEIIKENSAEWFTFGEHPELILDHSQMAKDAVEQLRYRASTLPIGFELLPNKFTMRQLHRLYESVYDQPLDIRNFTKRINQLDIIVKLKEKDKTSSKRGSYLFQFDKEKYEQLKNSGARFKI